MASVALQTIIEAPAVTNIRESANRIWLAGLGAFAKTQEEGEKLFQTQAAMRPPVETCAGGVSGSPSGAQHGGHWVCGACGGSCG